MRQIEPAELAHIIKFELGRLSAGVFRDMASGHQSTRDRALNMARDRLLKRMEQWEIIVPEPSKNVFQNVGEGCGKPGDPGA